jgi:predicted TIM-barrel fold metal-dependent hydrolase
LIVVDPKQPEKSLEQVRRYGTHEKCAGLKTIQDLYGMGLDHAAYEPLLQAAEEAGLTVMAHIPGMLKAAERFSRVTFVCAHATHDRVASMFGQPNIYFDLATSHHDAAETRLELFLERAGEDRLIFASDAPLMDPSWTLGKIASASFSGAQLEKIFKTNAEKAFPRLRGASKAAAGRRS